MVSFGENTITIGHQFDGLIQWRCRKLMVCSASHDETRRKHDKALLSGDIPIKIIKDGQTYGTNVPPF